MTPDNELAAARAHRITELEARLAQRNPPRALLPISIMGLIAACVLLILERRDIGYFFSPREPLNLGVEGDYRIDRLRSNRFAQVHGIPTSRGAYAQESGETFVIVGLRETPLIVRRRALDGENWQPGAVPPQPIQTPFAIRGRLLSREEAGRYEDGFRKLEAFGEVRPSWILIQGPPPGQDPVVAAWSGGLGLFGVMNAYLLLRALRRRRAAAA